MNPGSQPQNLNVVPVAKESSFDLVKLISKALRYWYLFVIGLIVALGLAYLKNKTWTPTYKIVSTILIEEEQKQRFGSGSSLSNSLSQGRRNINNQKIIYESYNLLSKAVDKLNITTDIYTKTSFYDKFSIRKKNLYKVSPIDIKSTFIADKAYGIEFQLKGIDETHYLISYRGNAKVPAFSVTGEYGKSIQHPLFFIEVSKTAFFQEPRPELYFRFMSKEQQIADYRMRLDSRFILEDASVMEISLTGKVAERDLDFMKILNDEFFIDNLSRKNASMERTIDFLNEQLSVLKDSMATSASKLNTYQVQAGIYFQDQPSRTGTELTGVEKERASIKLKKEYVNFLTDYLKKDSELLIPPSSAGIQDPGLTALVEEYNGIAINMKTLGPESPIYRRYKLQQDELKKGLNEAIRTMKSSIQIEESNVTGRYNKIMREISSFPEKERQLLIHERDFKINDSYNTYLMQKRIETQIQKASNNADNFVLDKPRIGYIVNAKGRLNTYIIFSIAGLLLPFLFVFFKEMLFKTGIQSKEEIEDLSGLPVMGVIDHSNKKELLVAKQYPRSGFAEGFRNLRSKIEYTTKKEDLMVLITSTEPEDGKTFVACNLAEIYQTSGKKTLLIDMDLRKPTLTKSLGLTRAKGISNYLTGQVSLSDILITSSDYGFDILPAGTALSNYVELLHSSKTKDMLSELKEMYNYILLDCSPVGLVSDAYFLSGLTDITLYVVRNEKTDRNFFKSTIKELVRNADNNIAIVYNDVRSRYGVSKQRSKKYNSYYQLK